MHFRNPFVSTCVAVALVVVSPSLPTLAYAKESIARSATVDSSRLRIDNFGQISQGYFRGEQPEGSDYADLARMGIKTVIDLQADGDNADEERFVREAGMTFHRIPMTTRVAPTPEQIEEFLEIVNAPGNQPVYVHCAGGRHRTGVMTAVYRMDHDGWAPDEAFQEMKQYKFGADFLHPEFRRFVYAYGPAPELATAVAEVTPSSHTN